MNAAVAHAVTRLLNHLDGSVPQTEATILSDLGFLIHRAGLATGVRPVVDVKAIVAALVTT